MIVDKGRIPRCTGLQREIAELADRLRVLGWGGVRPDRAEEYDRLARRKWELEQALRREVAP